MLSIVILRTEWNTIEYKKIQPVSNQTWIKSCWFTGSVSICHFQLNFTLCHFWWGYVCTSCIQPCLPSHPLKIGVCVCVCECLWFCHTHQMLSCCTSSGLTFQREIKVQGFAFANRLMELDSYSWLELMHTNVLPSRNTFPLFKTYVE